MLVPRVIDVNTVLPELGKSLRRLLRADIVLTISAATGAARIISDPALIEQLIINLAMSPREAMPQGGMIAFATATTELDPAYTLSHPAVTPGGVRVPLV